MRRYLKIVSVITASSFVFACMGAGLPSATPVPAAGPTNTSTPQETGLPSVSLLIPDGLATDTLTGTVPAFVPHDETERPVPEYVHILVECEPYNTCTIHSADIKVYPSSELAAKDPRAAGDISHLQKVLAKPDASYSKEALPGLPPPYASLGIALSAQEKVISFKNGKGVRYLLELKSDVSPIVNDLTYFFSGLTDDGKYYITGEFGTSLPTLQDDAGSNSVPPGGVPFPTDLNGQAYDDYMKQVTDLINASSPDKFSPPLNSLDILFQSVSIK